MNKVFSRRRAGLLLHPTSLPDPAGLGKAAFDFVDFLQSAGLTVWQMLPLGPTHSDGSPYQSLSVHAGNHLLIDLEDLHRSGWLQRNPSSESGETGREACLREAHAGFLERASPGERDALAGFLRNEARWLDDFALYSAIRRREGYRPWFHWPAPLRDREPAELEETRANLAAELDLVRFEQFLFFRQWAALRRYANDRGVLLFGDMPIFVAHDSAEVWAHREYFALDAAGRAETVTGVPPDYFSATGQRWGNPHYRWERMEADGFSWWVERLRTQLREFDLLRIDHFRGFEACWEIPGDARTARDGRWVAAPGRALFERLQQTFGELPLVAEDLGTITPAVHKLRRQFAFPGMKVLQFAFDGSESNPYLPHHHSTDSVVYTGTHDNDTTVGWFDSLDSGHRDYVSEYFGRPREPMPWPLIRAALASVAELAIIPLQDVLELNGSHRLNTPGTSEGNWLWRFEWNMIPAGLAERLRRMVTIYSRAT